MLSLDDPRWADLSHAYGPAADIPQMLRHLAVSTGPKSDYMAEPWFSLWSSLCHQGDVFDASYAAVPHLVEIVGKASGPIDFCFFQLPAAVEVARNKGRGPSIPGDLLEPYTQGILGLVDCVAKRSSAAWDNDTLISAFAALAVAKGHHRTAEAILNLDDDLIERLINLDFAA